MSSLSVRYAYERRLQDAANAAGCNYWYAYVEEILSRLGVGASPVGFAACADPEVLREIGVLVLGNFQAGDLPQGADCALAHWVRSGGVLIAFATEGLDELFGVAGDGVVPQTSGPFSISGYYEFQSTTVTEGCRAPVAPHQKLIVLSPLRLLRCTGTAELARLFLCDPERPGDGALARSAERPAIVHRALGSGHLFYFAFNVAQTMWTIQQGRPVDRDYDGDGYLRVSDACVIGDNSRAVPYADALHFLLGNMIGRRPVPMIHQIPARQGNIPPALLFFGGDDEGMPGDQVIASDFMARHRLPYHINAMPDIEGKFAFSREEQARIEANGHEIALHYNFMDGFTHPCGFTRDDVCRQADMFRARFGRDPECSVMHWCRWTGWAEPARWIRECGGRADNSYIHWTSPPLNPVNTIGFAFGSAFPRALWDDAAHGNARIDFVEIPIVAYEVGYLQNSVCPEKTRAAFDLAIQYHLTLNYFYHPVYVAQYPTCQEAIRELTRLIGGLPVPPVLMGPDELSRWWAARRAATVGDATQTDRRIAFEAECSYGDGFVVKVPVGDASVAACRVDGTAAEVEMSSEFGGHWAFLALPRGAHKVVLTLQP